MVRDPNYLRDRVRDRDRGVCAFCGLDCLALGDEVRTVRNRVLREWKETFPGRRLSRDREHFRRFLRDHPEWVSLGEILDDRGFRGWARRRELWDADHIHPVSLGGGECGLENLQTLCVACHKRKSAQDLERILPVRREASRRTSK